MSGEGITFLPAEPEPHYCAECVHLVGRRTILDQAPTWKCAHQNNVSSISKDLVTGITIYHYAAGSCYDARQRADSCGPQGVWWEKYTPLPTPAHHSPLVSRGSRKVGALPSADDLLNELGVDT